MRDKACTMKKEIILLLGFLSFQIIKSSAQSADIIIRHGKLIDGTGNQWQWKDVAIKNNKIVDC